MTGPGAREAVTAGSRSVSERLFSIIIGLIAYVAVVAVAYYAILGAFGWRLSGFFFGFVTCAAIDQARKEWST